MLLAGNPFPVTSPLAVLGLSSSLASNPLPFGASSLLYQDSCHITHGVDPVKARGEFSACILPACQHLQEADLPSSASLLLFLGAPALSGCGLHLPHRPPVMISRCLSSTRSPAPPYSPWVSSPPFTVCSVSCPLMALVTPPGPDHLLGLRLPHSLSTCHLRFHLLWMHLKLTMSMSTGQEYQAPPL